MELSVATRPGDGAGIKNFVTRSEHVDLGADSFDDARDVPSEHIDIIRDRNTSHAYLGIDRIDRHGAHCDQQIATAGHRGLAFNINQTVVGRKRRGFAEGDRFHNEIELTVYTLT
jgi:hypothetical protein